jgi:hypothetical protein
MIGHQLFGSINVRFTPKADMRDAKTNVRFGPEADKASGPIKKPKAKLGL